VRDISTDSPRITSLPSTDGAFARVVRSVLDAQPEMSARELEWRLRTLYPDVAVRERGLSGEARAFYVYRDGRFRPESRDEWWRLPGVARARVSPGTGRFTDVSEEWADLMRGRPSDFVGLHFTELVGPEAREAAATFLGSVIDLGEIGTEGLVVRGDGTSLTIEFHAIRDGDRIEVFYRPLY
jgi:hypothetical protein